MCSQAHGQSGREILERELKRAHVRIKIDSDLVAVAQEMGYSDLDRLLAAVGRGDLSHAKVVVRVTPKPQSTAEKVLALGRENVGRSKSRRRATAA